MVKKCSLRRPITNDDVWWNIVNDYQWFFDSISNDNLGHSVDNSRLFSLSTCVIFCCLNLYNLGNNRKLHYCFQEDKGTTLVFIIYCGTRFSLISLKNSQSHDNCILINVTRFFSSWKDKVQSLRFARNTTSARAIAKRFLFKNFQK